MSCKMRQERLDLGSSHFLGMLFAIVKLDEPHNPLTINFFRSASIAMTPHNLAHLLHQSLLWIRKKFRLAFHFIPPNIIINRTSVYTISHMEYFPRF